VSEASRVDVVLFVLDRLDEDEQVARAATPGPWERMGRVVHDSSPPTEWLGMRHIAASGDYNTTAEHLVRHDPARVLLEVKAKRAMIGERGAGVCDCDDTDSPPTWWKDRSVALVHHTDCVAQTVAACLAQVWSDHPDYRSEWVDTP
jgi:hypothetical protein